MPLSASLRNINLTFRCPRCGHALVMKGAWFQTVRGFKCEGCQRMLRLTYDDKVALFDKHAHLILQRHADDCIRWVFGTSLNSRNSSPRK